MNNLAVGVELLITGMSITFLVLILLMYLMKATSSLIARQKRAKEAEPRQCSLATVAQESSARNWPMPNWSPLWLLSARFFPADQQAVIRVAPLGATGAEDEESWPRSQVRLPRAKTF